MVFETSDAVTKLVFILVAVQRDKLLTQQLPQPLYRHQIRTVGRQVPQVDSQFFCAATDRECMAIAHIVPD